ELIARGRELERPLLDALLPLCSSPLVAEVRAGTGFLAAVELKPEVLDASPKAVAELAASVRANGVLVRPLVRAVATSPPLTADGSPLRWTADAPAAGLAELETSVAAAAAG